MVCYLGASTRRISLLVKKVHFTSEFLPAFSRLMGALGASTVVQTINRGTP